MKECTYCKETKNLNEYHNCNSREDGLDGWCKSCKTEYSKGYYLRNKEKIKQRTIERHRLNKDKENYRKTREDYRLRTLEYNKEYKKEYREKNKDKIKEDSIARYYANHEERKRKLREYQKTDNAKELSSERHKKRWDNDEIYRLKMIFRGRTYEVFKRKDWKKESKTVDMLGVSIEVAKAHLEKQFTKGMSWDNHGEWHIDHIIPLASANTKEELIKLCHYTNLQPLWAKDNLEKSDKIIETQMKLRI